MEKRVLFAVLDWGLGHATRSVPIIRSLLNQQLMVEVCTRGKAAEYLKALFPDLLFHELTDDPVTYSKKGAQWALIKRVIAQPSINTCQHEFITRIVKERAITHVISDNVYGAFSDRAKTALVTHQLSLKTPTLSKQINQKLASWINRFDEVWIPDDPKLKLSADLGKNKELHIPQHYLGLLSQMKEKEVSERIYKIGVVLGGPEPQRSILEERLLNILNSLDQKAILFRGVIGAGEQKDHLLTVKDLGNAEEMYASLKDCELIISRSGYSSVMDLFELGKRNLLIPTPGQTEQEYLAESLTRFPGIYAIDQSKLTSKLITELLEKNEKERRSPKYFTEDSGVIAQFLEL